MSSDAPTTATEEAPRYDAFGFRLEAETGFASKNQDDYVLPDVVQRNRVRSSPVHSVVAIACHLFRVGLKLRDALDVALPRHGATVIIVL